MLSIAGAYFDIPLFLGEIPVLVRGPDPLLIILLFVFRSLIGFLTIYVPGSLTFSTLAWKKMPFSSAA